MDRKQIREQLLADNAVRDQIGLRAFEIFKQSGYVLGRDFENWVQAEKEILTPMVDAKYKQAKKSATEMAAAVTESAGAEESVAAVENGTPKSKATAKKAPAKKASTVKVEEKTADPVVEAPKAEKAPAKTAKAKTTAKAKK